MGRAKSMREEGSGEDVKAKNNNKNKKRHPPKAGGGREDCSCYTHRQVSSKDQASRARAGLLAAT